MDRPTIYTALQLEAISGILNRSDINFYRRVCRWYSKEFHTPLHIVIEGKVVQWDEILLNYYESQMEDIGYNQVYDMAIQEYIPELAEKFEDENQAFANALIAEQHQTIAKKKAKDKAVEEKLASNHRKTTISGANLAPTGSEKKTEDPATDKTTPPTSMRLSFEDENV